MTKAATGPQAGNLSTNEFAAARRVNPQTIRNAYCKFGHYLGVKPIKSANRFLLWPAAEVERLTAGTEGSS